MIPLATTTIDVLRVAAADDYAEPYSGDDTSRRTTVAQGVRAVIGRPPNRAGGKEDIAGGEQSVWDFELVCDHTDIRYTDTVKDNHDGSVYRVVWVQSYPQEHTEAGLRIVHGEV